MGVTGEALPLSHTDGFPGWPRDTALLSGRHWLHLGTGDPGWQMPVLVQTGALLSGGPAGFCILRVWGAGLEAVGALGPAPTALPLLMAWEFPCLPTLATG